MMRLKFVSDMAVKVWVEGTPVSKGIRKDTDADRGPEGSERLLWEGLTDVHQSTLYK